ncbi:hypothetical protein C8R45DRAFT_1112490 [Mycena sanguinolenta]|nr:hypothetical protein C8R45DRAFT_1112490 [Mycena sanguinolenta]
MAGAARIEILAWLNDLLLTRSAAVRAAAASDIWNPNSSRRPSLSCVPTGLTLRNLGVLSFVFVLVVVCFTGLSALASFHDNSGLRPIATPNVPLGCICFSLPLPSCPLHVCGPNNHSRETIGAETGILTLNVHVTRTENQPDPGAELRGNGWRTVNSYIAGGQGGVVAVAWRVTVALWVPERALLTLQYEMKANRVGMKNFFTLTTLRKSPANH